MIKYNACINYISSRNKCIQYSLLNLWNNFNHIYNYPVYVYYFDDIYDSKDVRNNILKSCPQNVIFRSIPYKTPEFIKEEELFYNRDLWYVKSRFPSWRKGYLHMCNFKCNLYKYENTDFHKFDYMLMHDDEAGYTKEMDFNPFEVISNKENLMGAYWFNDRTKSGISRGNIETTLNLWDLAHKFIKENKLNLTNIDILALMNDPNASVNINGLNILGTYVIKTKMFETDLWKKWIKAVNESGGVYKYRWGDNDVYTLFMLMTEHGAYNFKAAEKGFHDVYKYRGIQDYAPGVKDVKR